MVPGDMMALGHLGLSLPQWGVPDRIERAANVYQSLTDTLAEFIRSSSGMGAIAAFRAAYPSAQVTDVKVVDLILWQTR
jgi:hypothetical protein